MAYEHKTYENILKESLDIITNKFPSVDTREGSLVYNAVAANSLKLAIAYQDMENTRNEGFPDTATREYLLKACRTIGMDISIFNATKAVFLGKFDAKVDIGSRWNNDLYNFVVLEPLESTDEYFWYRLQSEATGSAPNIILGVLTPIDTVPVGLTYAEITECLILGEEETTTETIREKYWEAANNEYGDGNIAQYQKWANEFQGIGAYLVDPLWNGGNTVRVFILDADNKPASNQLINDFQFYLDPPTATINDNVNAVDYPQGRGMGNGVAPIGAIVTVSTASEYPVDVHVVVVLGRGYIKPTGVEEAVVEYFEHIAYSKSVVSYMAIGAAVQACDCVEYLVELKVNNAKEDIILTSDRVATLGAFTYEIREMIS